MLLSHKTIIKLNNDYSCIIGLMCYAAYKLWNVCNYERLHYKELNLPVKYPNWYYQKKAHKNDIWFKQLPSQSAQEVCKQLEKSWQSFYALKRTGGIENPNPPRFKNNAIAITYIQNAITHDSNSDIVRLSLPKGLKQLLRKTYGICENYLFLKNKIFKNTDSIKQLVIYPPKNGKCLIIVTYEVGCTQPKPDNGKYLSIDLGLHNLLTCYNSMTGETFIIGRKYLSICNYFNKEISRIQSQHCIQQSKKGFKYTKTSNHARSVYNKKNNRISDYLHKVSRYIVDYCKAHDINTVVIGNIKGIRKNKNFGNITNQKLHALPYDKIYALLEYKCVLEGITFVKQDEAYSSQTSPLKMTVNSKNADKENRLKRGLYKDGSFEWNADCVGAFNILRLYFQKNNIGIFLAPTEIKMPYIVKVAA